MIRMVISCGGGMSSSALSVHVNKQIIEKGLQEQVSVDFIPFPLLINPKTSDLAFPMYRDKEAEAKVYDIVLLCPHLQYYALDAIKKHTVHTPMYIMPSLMYGNMQIEDLLEDSIELLELYQHQPDVLMHFPDEKYLEIKRNTSHRRWLLKHPH